MNLPEERHHPSSLPRRLAAGASISTLILAVTFIGQILAVPIFLTHWGAAVYGEWLVLTGTALTLNMLNLGIQSYTINLLIHRRTVDDFEGGTRILHSAMSLYVLLGSAGLVILLAMAFLPGALAALNITLIPPGQARFILIIYGLIAIYGIFGGLFMGQFKVVQQMPRQLAYSLVERIIFLFVPLVLAWAGLGPAGAAIGVGFAFAGITLVELLDISRRSAFQFGFAKSSWSLARSLIKPSLMFFAIGLSTVLLTTGMNLVITWSIGAVAVALFTTAVMLINFVRTIMYQGLNVLWPEITNAGALADDPARLQRWHRLAVKTGGVFAIFCAGGIVAFGFDFLQFWTKGELAIDRMLVFILAVYLVVLSPPLVSSIFGMALNRPGEIFKVQLFFTIFSLAGAWAMMPRFGLNGAALAMCFGQLLILPVQVRLAAGWCTDSPGAFWRAVMLRWTVFAILFITLSIALGHVQPLGMRIAWFSAGSLVLLAGFFKLGLTVLERQSLLASLRQILGRYPHLQPGN